MVVIAPAVPLPPVPPRVDAEEMFMQSRDSFEGWERWNRNYWIENYEDFLEFYSQRQNT